MPARYHLALNIYMTKSLGYYKLLQFDFIEALYNFQFLIVK